MLAKEGAFELLSTSFVVPDIPIRATASPIDPAIRSFYVGNSIRKLNPTLGRPLLRGKLGSTARSALARMPAC